MKKIFTFCGVVGLIFGFGIVSAQVDPMNLPALSQYVTDFGGVLNQSQIDELNQVANTYDKQTSTQIVTVLIPNRNGNELFDIGMNIFKKNKIGQAKINNGLLLVISTEEKKIRIVVGYGLEGTIPDALASRIIEQDIRPYVNSGDLVQAIKNFYSRSISAIASDEGLAYLDKGSDAISSQSDSDDSDPSFWLGIMLGGVLGSILKSWKKKKSLGRKILVIVSVIVLLACIAGFASFALAFLASFFWGTAVGVVLGLTGLLGLILSMRGGGGFGGGGFGGGGFGGGGFSGGGGDSGGGGAGD